MDLNRVPGRNNWDPNWDQKKCLANSTNLEKCKKGVLENKSALTKTSFEKRPQNGTVRKIKYKNGLSWKSKPSYNI